MAPVGFNLRRVYQAVYGASVGVAAVLDWLARNWDGVDVRAARVSLACAAVLGAVAALTVQQLGRMLVGRLRQDPRACLAYVRYEWVPSLALAPVFLGMVGIFVTGAQMTHMAVLWVVLLVGLALLVEPSRPHDSGKDSRSLVMRATLPALFLVSGMAALIYQVVWQRALFAAFGSDTDSVALIVSIFMLGLGLGAATGGLLSKRFPNELPQLFLASELLIGCFGASSLWLIRSVSRYTVTLPVFGVGASIFLLLIVPTVLMGATLPILVAHAVRTSHDVGRSVSLFYSVNTVGSAVACFLCGYVLLAHAGMTGAVRIAAVLNLTVGLAVFAYARRLESERERQAR